MRRSLLSRVVGKLREERGPAAPPLVVSLPAREETSSAPPIFVIGVQRSGTSLLRRILDSHSNIACPPESKFIGPLAELITERRYLTGFSGMGFEQAEVARAVSRFIRSFFDTYAASQGKGRWADKTPNYIDCLPELWELFGPEVRFVHLIRHGMDVAFSLSDEHRGYPAINEQAALAGGDRAVGAGRFWAIQSEKMEAFREAVPQVCHVIRYEDLTTDPASALRPMFEFLGEPWEPDVIDYAKFPHHAGWEDPDVRRRRAIVANSQKYMTWPADVQAVVREACQPMLSRLGYE
jgi:protein-tyrosine sulfotransferase